MSKSLYKKVVIIFLHVNFNSYLLQLRDFEPSILYPGHWGGFGGAAEGDETSRVAAARELEEEIGYCPKELHFFREFYTDSLMINTSIFYSNLGIPLSQLRLREGMDMDLFTREEILTKKLYFKNLGAVFPVAPPLVIFFNEFFDFISSEVKTFKNF